MCDDWVPLATVSQNLTTQMSEMVEETEVIQVVKNAMDQDNGQPLFQIMTPDPEEMEK